MKHIRECSRISLEIKTRLNGLHPEFYLHRSLNELQKLETFYYHQPGERPFITCITCLDIFNFVNFNLV